MPPIETGVTRPIGRIEPGSLNLRGTRSAGGSASGPATTATDTSAASGVELGDTLDPGAPPVNADRVTQIRKALEKGTYPILPTTVADAIIAAGLILRTTK